MELLFEIGTEEIPSTYVGPALAQTRTLAETALGEAGLGFSGLRVAGTPRRIVLVVEGLAERQKDSTEVFWGPPVKAAYDAEGKPTAAATGFAKGQGVDTAALRRGQRGKSEYVYVERKIEGAGAAQVMPPVLDSLVRRITFPKTMRWESSGMRFARPIRWVVALLDGHVLPLSIGDVTSGNWTMGHRLLANHRVEVASARDYFSKMEKAFVIVDHEERRRLVETRIAEAARLVKGEVVPDSELLERVTFMVEWPLAILGHFDPKFLKMPKDVTVTALREHQDFFSVRGSNGDLLPHFVAVANLDRDRSGKVKAGNERVLNARLEDALFYWNEDVRDGLEKMAQRLEQVVWQERLGTVAQKTRRVADLALDISRSAGLGNPSVLKRAALFSKADLTSQMVREKEFSSLQGVMGREYAAAAGEPAEVARAISEHYLPRFADDLLPESPDGTVLALADRVDTIVGYLGVGLLPTGSEDPYGLRRQATGVVRILMERGMHIPLGAVVRRAIGLYGETLAADESQVAETFFGFLRLRLENLLVEKGYAADIVNAALDAGIEDPADVAKKVEALKEFRSDAAFDALATGFKRAYNITKAGIEGEPAEGLFESEAETALYKSYLSILPEFEKLLVDHRYLECFRLLAGLAAPINQFFESVMVMSDREEIRQNRLRLLSRITQLFLGIANLSRMEAR